MLLSSSFLSYAYSYFNYSRNATLAKNIVYFLSRTRTRRSRLRADVRAGKPRGRHRSAATTAHRVSQSERIVGQAERRSDVIVDRTGRSVYKLVNVNAISRVMINSHCTTTKRRVSIIIVKRRRTHFVTKKHTHARNPTTACVSDALRCLSRETSTFFILSCVFEKKLTVQRASCIEITLPKNTHTHLLHIRVY